MLTLWIVVIVLGVLQLFEIGLLMFLLRALGEMRQNGSLTTNNAQSPETWGLAVGEKAPYFVATDYNGKPVRLDDFQGQRRILAFVSPGCSACDIALESLNAINESEKTYATLIIGGLDSGSNHRYALDHHSLVPILTPIGSI